MPSPPTPQDWLIHQCLACDSPMKIRTQTIAAGTRISCPVCLTPVALHLAEPQQKEEFRAELLAGPRKLLPELPRAEFFERLDVEFTGVSGRPAGPPSSRPVSSSLPSPAPEDSVEGDRGTDSGEGFLGQLKHTSDYESRRKVRHKKKRKAGLLRPEEVGDWDTAQGELPEARVVDDPWLVPLALPEEVVHESESQFVVSEVRNEGGVKRRVKRVKKRLVDTLAREFFRRLTFSMRLFIVGLVVILIGWAVWAVWDVIRTKWVAIFYKEEVEKARPSQIFLTSQDESGAMEVLRKFLAATTIEEKLKWVRLPDRVRPMMSAWYAKYPDGALIPGGIVDRDKILASTGKDKLYLVQLELEVDEPGPLEPGRTRKSRRWYFMEEVGSAEQRSYKVDWEMAVKYQPMSWEQFRTQRPVQPVAFRVKLRGDDYYNHGFTDEKKWQAVYLYYPDPDDGENFLFHGYLEDGTQAWRDLKVFTNPGNSAAYILRLRFPQDARSADQVIVDGVEHKSWFYTAGDKK